MAFQFCTRFYFLLCFSLIVTISSVSSRRAVVVGVYWGQSKSEGTLLDPCATGNYQILNIAFLNSYGSGRIELDLDGRCNPSKGECTRFSQEIKSCQRLGIKVLISIGGGFNGSDDATTAANYIWNNFLSGNSNSRPLGDAVLDGVNLVHGGGYLTSGEWNTLAIALEKLNQKQRKNKKLYLSASPQCSFPDWSLQPALDTGLFDYVWVQFYNNPSCEYGGGELENFFQSWNNWREINASQVFVELPAAAGAAPSGYIPPDVFKTRVLPEIEQSSKFGGVALWSRVFDEGFSSAINPKVCGSAAEIRSEGDMTMFPMGDKYGGARGFRTCTGTCQIL